MTCEANCWALCEFDMYPYHTYTHASIVENSRLRRVSQGLHMI